MRVFGLLLILTLAGTVLDAQSRANTRKGFWIGFGLGDGSAGLDCNSCTEDRINAWSGYLRMGGTVSPSVLLGGETNGWFHSEGGINESLGFATFIVMWYPSRKGALYLKFGVGGMAYQADDGVDELSATAPCLSLGVGYEFRLGQNFSLAPFLNTLASSTVSARLNGTAFPTDEDYSFSLVQFGVGFTWH